MTTGRTKLLFSWEDVDSLPDLRRLRLVLDWLPDNGSAPSASWISCSFSTWRANTLPCLDYPTMRSATWIGPLK